MEKISENLGKFGNLRNWISRAAKRLNALSNVQIVRSGNSDSVHVTENGLLINLRRRDEADPVAAGGTTVAHPFAMTFGLDGSDNPIVTFETAGTEVYKQGTNDFYAPTASLQDGPDPTGKPSNIEDEIALTSSAVNYIYLEALYDDASKTEPDDFAIVVYTTEKALADSDVDTSATPNEVFQYEGRRLIGTIELNADDELDGSGLVQYTTTRLEAILSYVSSDVAYLMLP